MFFPLAFIINTNYKDNVSLSREIKSNGNNVDDSTKGSSEHKGSVIMDATAYPQDIAYFKDLNLHSEARKISEPRIDTIYENSLSSNKPRIYPKVPRKTYLQVAKKSSFANVT